MLDEQPFDFNKLIPILEVLHHTGSGAGHRSWYVIGPAIEPGDPGWEVNERPFTNEERAPRGTRRRKV